MPGWGKSRKRKPISTSKIYLFDPGVTRFLQNRKTINPGSPEFGEAFETYLFHELKAYADYRSMGEVCYWRSVSGFEVDFIFSDEIAIEVKASSIVSPQDLKGLRALKEEKKLKHYVVICLEKNPRTVDGIRILPWDIFLNELWAGNFD